MNPEIPTLYVLLFAGTVLLTAAIWILALKQHRSSPNTWKVWMGITTVWLSLQAVLAWTGFYSEVPNQMPPPFLAAIGPPMLLILLTFLLPRGRRFMDELPVAYLTWIHTVRIPVEITLLGLFLAGTVPQLMTFEGRNFDILSGLTAPLVAFLYFRRKKLSASMMLAWNIICLGLVLFIVGNAILSAPTPLQQFAFDQPNIGVFYFPFIWLPAFVVPVVIFSHLVSIRYFLRSRKSGKSNISP